MFTRLIILWFILGFSYGQVFDVSVTLEEISISGMPGLQSYSWGKTSDGKWVIVGGRTTGLHRRQPFASFGEAGNNKNIYVVSPADSQVWSAPLNVLPASIYEQLQSTNQEFIQRGNTLYVIGGYGYSATVADHITYDKLTAIHLDSVAKAVIDSTDITPWFRQIQDARLQTTGGQLGYKDSVFYLCGGQKFMGRYNPMNGPSFTQEYTNQIRKFKIIDNDTTLSITDYSAYTDAANLHRRDYNMYPQIFPDGTEGFTMFTGVFQTNVDLPFLTTVNVFDTGYAHIDSFSAYLSHYHSAKVGVYDSTNNLMHTIFFGGMAQYYLDSVGNLIQNDSVPFVNTISVISRDSAWKLSERKIGEMPGLLGASAEFIPVSDSSGLYYKKQGDYYGHIVNFDKIPVDSSVFIGYIFGGIESSAPNIFWINDGTQSWASTRIFKVYLSKKLVTNLHTLTAPQIYQPKLFPNPTKGTVTLQVFIPNINPHTLEVFNLSGQKVYSETFRKKIGNHRIPLDFSDLPRGKYFLRIGDNSYKATLSFIKQ